MKLMRISIGQVLILAAVVLAFGLRFYQLGAQPLTDSEAALANQALQVSRSLQLDPAITDMRMVMGPHPAYVLLTGVVFTILGDSTFSARFIPALAGSLLILIPLLVVSRIRQIPALDTALMRAGLVILAFGMAIDPGLVTVSRQIGGPIIAVSLSLLALSAWLLPLTPTVSVLAGIAAGTALLGGPAIFNVILSLVLSLLLLRVFTPGDKGSPGTTLKQGKMRISRNKQTLLLTTAAAFLVIGTLMGQVPQGISAWIDSLQTYLLGWVQAGVSGAQNSTIIQMILALGVYGLLPLVFLLIGLVRQIIIRDADTGVKISESDHPDSQNINPNSSDEISAPQTTGTPTQTLAEIPPVSLSRAWWAAAVWAGFSLLLSLIYPNRQVSDLILSLALIWFLASPEMAGYLSLGGVAQRQAEKDEYFSLPVALVLACFVFTLMALFWFTVSAFSRQLPTQVTDNIRWLVPLGTLILVGLTSILVSLGWSSRTGVQGFFWGFSAALIVYTISALWGSAYLRPNQPQELYSLRPGSGDAQLLHHTLDTISIKETGFTRSVDTAVMVDSPALLWELRGYDHLNYLPSSQTGSISPLAGEQPAVVITSSSQDEPALSAAYTGQDFTWSRLQGWDGDIPPNFLRWLNYREAPINNAKIIVWVRADIIQDEPGDSVPTEEIP